MLNRIDHLIRMVSIKLGNLKQGDDAALRALSSLKNKLQISQLRITWWNIWYFRRQVNKVCKMANVFLQSPLPEDDACFNNDNVRYLLIPIAR